VHFDIIDDSYSSRCFGVPFVTLKIRGRTSSLGYLIIARNLAEGLQNLNLHYIVCKHRLQDVSVIHGLEEIGFRLMGVGAKLSRMKDTAPITASIDHAVRVEPYEQTHLELFTLLLDETQNFFYGTHYYNSPYLDSKLVDRFYSRWIMADLQDRCNKNFVALQNDRIVGFITGMERHDEAKLDLVWVDESVRRRGIGKLLINTLLSNIKPSKLVCDAYITEKKALGLYLATGFEIQDVYAIYHKYLGAPTGDSP
jgi:ribosomal protein S18 acetylase RimI-like enzyme